MLQTRSVKLDTVIEYSYLMQSGELVWFIKGFQDGKENRSKNIRRETPGGALFATVYPLSILQNVEIVHHDQIKLLTLCVAALN